MRLKNTSQEFRIQNTFNKLHPIAHNSIYVKFVFFFNLRGTVNACFRNVLYHNIMTF